MLKRQFSLVLIALMLVTIAMPATAQLPSPPDPQVGVPVQVTGTSRQGGAITGTFTILEFVRTGPGTIGAAGTLVARTARGDTLVKQIVMPVRLPSNVVVTPETPSAAVPDLRIQAAQAPGSCTVLELTLGPLDLNLAGLEVHLDTVHLLIEATPALGILGQILQILCGGAGNPLGTIITLLNQILAVLNAIVQTQA